MEIVAQTTAPLRRHLGLIVGFALYGTWMLLTFATNLYFTENESVIDACWFSVVFFAGATATLLLALLRGRRRLFNKPLSPPIEYGIVIFLAVSSTLCTIMRGSEMELFFVGAALAGTSFGAFQVVLASAVRTWDIKESMASVAWTLTLSSILLFFVCWVVDPNRVAIVAMCLLIASLPCTQKGLDRTEGARNPSNHSKLPASAPVRADSPTRRATFVNTVFSLFAGFFMSYVAVMMPRSLHFAGILVAETLPGISFAVLSALAIIPATLLVTTAVLYTRRPPFVGFTLLVMVLFAGVCLTTPSLSSFGMLHAGAVSPLAALLALIAWGLARPPQTWQPEAKPSSAVTPFDVLVLGGAALAAVFALWFIAVDEYSNKALASIIGLIPVALAIATMLLLLARRADIAQRLIPSLQFKEQLDTSILSNRCRIIGDAYGLTKREREILELYCAGRDVPYIESMLNLAKSTVKTHTTHIYQKTGVGSKQELLSLVHQEGDALNNMQ